MFFSKILWKSATYYAMIKAEQITERGFEMSKKIVAVNAGPRKGWNTDTLINEAVKGAQAQGAEVQKFDLFRLEKYTGCVMLRL